MSLIFPEGAHLNAKKISINIMTNECLRTYQNGYKKMYVAITNVFFSFSLTVILLFLSRQFSFMFG